MADKKVVPQGFVEVVVENMEPIPAGDNPFWHDSFNMGTIINDNWMIMHTGSNQRPLPYMILVNSATGQRINLKLNQINEDKFYDQTGKAFDIKEIPDENINGKYIVHTQLLNNVKNHQNSFSHELLKEIVNIPLKVGKHIIQDDLNDFFSFKLDPKHFPVLGGKDLGGVHSSEFVIVEDYDGYYSLFDSEE
ncbi:hypothetical protein [Yersinia phage vB_Yru_GN1]|uniref:Uncharacterized protein n=1 Tax=Yersinia phage vB_Yru_GN1 TaxID=3074381 RepID=A0AA86MA78_9CAUD|nr:hypothetical protein [Yersinia phage vB_Yru_GN1]